MNQKEFAEKVLQSIAMYYSPFVTVESSITLGIANAVAQGLGRPIKLTSNFISEIEKLSSNETTDDLTFGITLRIAEKEGYYFVCVLIKEANKILNKQPDSQGIICYPFIQTKNEWINQANDAWFNKAFIVKKSQVVALTEEEFHLPETD